jgi:hypothetical protein
LQPKDKEINSGELGGDGNLGKANHVTLRKAPRLLPTTNWMKSNFGESSPRAATTSL